MSIFPRMIVPALMAALCVAGPLNLAGRSQANAQTAATQDQPSEETWNSIKGDIFKDRPILDGTGLVVHDGGILRTAWRLENYKTGAVENRTILEDIALDAVPGFFRRLVLAGGGLGVRLR